MAAKRVLCYLLGTVSLGIMIESVAALDSMSERIISALSTYSDSDWTVVIQFKKSTGGYIVMLNGSFVS